MAEQVDEVVVRAKRRRWLTVCACVAVGLVGLTMFVWVLRLNWPGSSVIAKYYNERRVCGLLVWHDGRYALIEVMTSDGKPVLDGDGNYIQDGVAQYWYENGQLLSKCQTVRGRLRGTLTQWYESGQLKVVEEYDSEGAPTSCRKWYESGVLEYEIEGGGRDAQMGKKIYYSPSGTLWRIENYEDGELSGEYCEYYNSGNVRVEGRYIHGAKVGTWRYWSDEGKVVRSTQYDP
ncbi:MAG: hypothetical protein H6839_08635 [Planctomycetes bacterium]|nr:hypothetical protein [Planctomycetota bacterium]